MANRESWPGRPHQPVTELAIGKAASRASRTGTAGSLSDSEKQQNRSLGVGAQIRKMIY